MNHPCNEAFVTWDNDPAAPGGMEPDFQQVFEAGQAAERTRIRRELLAEAGAENPLGASLADADFVAVRLRAFADRVCPEE